MSIINNISNTFLNPLHKLYFDLPNIQKIVVSDKEIKVTYLNHDTVFKFSDIGETIRENLESKNKNQITPTILTQIVDMLYDMSESQLKSIWSVIITFDTCTSKPILKIVTHKKENVLPVIHIRFLLDPEFNKIETFSPDDKRNYINWNNVFKNGN